LFQAEGARVGSGVAICEDCVLVCAKAVDVERRLSILLVDATLELLDAAIEDEARLGELLGATVAEGWADFPEVLPRLRDALRQGGIAHGWGTILFVLQEPRTLVGFGGYKGAPSEEGVVEIGYAVAPGFRRRGIAGEVVRLLVARAFAEPRVRAVIAQTLAESNPSTRVLQKRDFGASASARIPSAVPSGTGDWIERTEGRRAPSPRARSFDGSGTTRTVRKQCGLQCPPLLAQTARLA
jgi:RimJ/RimL family protein N-acetyltransferase